ncbi:MAG: BamA/TamA family outer membrane protein [Saprospiraceae bacterium]
MKRHIPLYWFLLCNLALLSAQESGGFVVLDSIHIAGNQRTRNEVILRELPFATADTLTLDILPNKLEEAERQLMNTGLFTSVEITYKNWEGATGNIQLLITLLETWYLFPVPTFELADRNFNVWWKEQNRSLQRVNIGMSIEHLNFTGWADKAKIGFEYGYTRSFKIGYLMPYLNKKRTLSLNINADYQRNREVNYATEGNKQLFYKDENRFIRYRLKAEAGVGWRPRLYGQHYTALEYHKDGIDSVVVQTLNPNYFEDGKTQVRFLRWRYKFDFDFRDNRAYPWSGYLLGGELIRDGLGVFRDRNALTLQLHAAQFWPIGQHWNISAGIRTKYSFVRRPQAVIYNRAIGFGDNKLSGYELYIVDGLDAAILRTDIRYKIWQGTIQFGKWMFWNPSANCLSISMLGLAMIWGMSIVLSIC